MKKRLIVAIVCILALTLILLCACAPETPTDLKAKLEAKYYEVEIGSGDEMNVVGADIEFGGALVASRAGSPKLIALWCADEEDAEAFAAVYRMLIKYDVFSASGLASPFGGDEEWVVDTWDNVMYVGTSQAVKDLLN